MAGRDPFEEEDDDLAAARWVQAVDEGLRPEQAEAFHAWLEAHPERGERIARQAALQGLAAAAQGHGVTSRRRLLLGAAATGAMVAGAAALMMRAPWEDRKAAFETAVGEVRAVTLIDTSRLWLDARTRVGIRMTRARRDMMLHAGRAFVSVALEPRRPFVVRGALFAARALSAAFEATAFRDRSGVAVTEGVVRFEAAGAAPIDIVAGEAVWIDASGAVQREPAPSASVAAWREQRIVLSGRRLDAALDELSRYFTRPLSVTDAQLAARRVSLSFSIADLDEADAAGLIAEVVGAAALDQGAAGVVLVPAPPGAAPL